MSKPQKGWPIFVYLAGLAGFAVAAAFLAALAVVVLLPPRPPGVARTDELLAAFTKAYTQARSGQAVARQPRLSFRIAREPSPEAERHPISRRFRAQIAQELRLDRSDVRVSARFLQADTFVVRIDRRPTALRPEHLKALQEELEEAREHGAAQRQTVTVMTLPPPRPGEAPAVPRPPGDLLITPGAPPAPPIPPVPLFSSLPQGVALLAGFEVSARLADGRWLIMRQGRNWAELGWIGRAALVLGAALLALGLMAALAARRLAAPIRSFADAVQAVGVNPQVAPVQVRGPRELRAAAQAVNAMQARLRALIADRTRTLAAVAHDMRTPLMRLRLAAETVEPEQRDRLAKEVKEVEALVASFIAFARDDPAEEGRVRLDLAALLESLVQDQAEAGHAVRYEGPERLVITGQSLGLKRLFANLLDNAFKHAQTCTVRLHQDGGLAIAEVADDGPGVPKAERERIFEPFVRLSGGGGAGLGLAAARSIARAHGGDITAGGDGSGAVFRVALPV